MKQLIMLSFASVLLATASHAQTTHPKKEKVEVSTKVKPKKSIKNRVHNAIHPNHKEYSGVKVKHEVKKEGA